jgi:hypothetical protein
LFWRTGRYRPDNVGETADTRAVTIVLDADPEAVVERERDRWDELEREGLIESWTTRTYETEYESVLANQNDQYGDIGGTVCIASSR